MILLKIHKDNSMVKSDQTDNWTTQFNRHRLKSLVLLWIEKAIK